MAHRVALAAALAPVNGIMSSAPSSVTIGVQQGIQSGLHVALPVHSCRHMSCVSCAGVWGCKAMGLTSGDSEDLGDSTTTASSLES